MSAPPPQRQLRVTTYASHNANNDMIVELIRKADQLELAEHQKTRSARDKSLWLQFYHYLVDNRNGPLRGYSNVIKRQDKDKVAFAKKFIVDITTQINNNIPVATQEAELSVKEMVAKEWIGKYNRIKERQSEAKENEREEHQAMQRTLNERERNMGFNYETASDQLRSLRREVGNTAIRRSRTITPTPPTNGVDQPNAQRRRMNDGNGGALDVRRIDFRNDVNDDNNNVIDIDDDDDVDDYQFVQQDANATLRAHLPGPVNRIRGRAALGNVDARNRDLVGYIDNNRARVQPLTAALASRTPSDLNRLRYIRELLGLANDYGGLNSAELSGNLIAMANDLTSSILDNHNNHNNNNNNNN